MSADDVLYTAAFLSSVLSLMALMGRGFVWYGRRMRDGSTRDFYLLGWWAIPIWLSHRLRPLLVATVSLLGLVVIRVALAR